MISRIRNSVIQAINARVKLPQVMPIIIEKDFIEHLMVDDTSYASISASLYGTWIEWLAKEIDAAFKTQNDRLPWKAQRSDTIIYWAATLNHKNYPFDLRAQIVKFNNCVESVVKIHDNMRLIKIKKNWNYEDSNLVNAYGRLTHTGIDHVWEAIDASVQFNFSKRTDFLAKTASMKVHVVKKEEEQAMTLPMEDRRDPMIRFFKKKRIQDYHAQCLWSKSGLRREDHRFQQSQFKHRTNRFLLPRIR